MRDKNAMLQSPNVAYFIWKIGKERRQSLWGTLLLLKAGREFRCIFTSFPLSSYYTQKSKQGWLYPPSSEYSGVYPKLFFSHLSWPGIAKRGQKESQNSWKTQSFYFYFNKTLNSGFSSLQKVTTIPQT